MLSYKEIDTQNNSTAIELATMGAVLFLRQLDEYLVQLIVELHTFSSDYMI